MSQRQLVIYEADPLAPGGQRLFAIDPADATGVPIPAFRYGAVRPQLGTLKGEAFIDTSTGIASVWDGNSWEEIARPVITLEATDADIIATAPPNGSVALSLASGNIFVRTHNAWRPLGIAVYADSATMESFHPPKGAAAYIEDIGTLAVRAETVSRPITARPAPIAVPVADIADFNVKVTGLLSSTNPGDYLEFAATAAIPAGTIPQLAADIDGANGDWLIRDAIGHLWVVRGHEAAAVGGVTVTPKGLAWARINNQGVYVGQIAPPHPLVGDAWLNDSRALTVWDGSEWVAQAARPVFVTNVAGHNPALQMIKHTEFSDLTKHPVGSWGVCVTEFSIGNGNPGNGVTSWLDKTGNELYSGTQVAIPRGTLFHRESATTIREHYRPPYTRAAGTTLAKHFPGDIFEDARAPDIGEAWLRTNDGWGRLTSKRAPRWDLIKDYRSGAMTNGYTLEFNLHDAALYNDYDFIRFHLSFMGQSLNIYVGPDCFMGGAINRSKHDGSGNYLHPSGVNNQHYAVIGRGTGHVLGHIMRRNVADVNASSQGGWLIGFNAYSALDSAGGWLAAGGDYWQMAGRLMFYPRVNLSWDKLRFGFSSFAGEAGAVRLIVEGLRSNPGAPT